MGMVLEHQLTASYAAGSLGGTLGRLEESLRRLSRANSTGSREKPGGADGGRIIIEPAKLAYLDQTLRLMADAWQSRVVAAPKVSDIEDLLDHLKETALTGLGGEKRQLERHSQYRLLAEALNGLKTYGFPWT